jgi:hypothetical protein
MPPGSASVCRRAGDVDAIAEDVVIVNDDVTDVDADAKLDPILGGDARITFSHTVLNVDRAAHSVDNAREFQQQAVTGRLDDRPPYSAIFGSISAWRCSFSPASVPLSSRPMRRE